MILPLDKGETIESLARDVTDYVVAGLPAEKKRAEAEMVATAQMLRAGGSVKTKEGLGQAIGSIPRTTWHRWNQIYPGCWDNKEFKAEFLYDNPQCCAPGYRPRPSQLRHGFTFTGGAAMYHSMKSLAKK